MIPLVALMISGYIMLRSFEIMLQDHPKADRVSNIIINILAAVIILVAIGCIVLILKRGIPADLSVLFPR